MLSIVQNDKRDHATAAPKAWSSLLRFPTVDGVARTVTEEESDYKARLGAVIVQLRGLRGGMSQAELAVAIHRSEPTLSRWELGKSQPSAYDLTQLARVLDAPPELLLDPPEKAVSPVALALAALRSAEAGAAIAGSPTPEDAGDPAEGDGRDPARAPRRKPRPGR